MYEEFGSSGNLSSSLSSAVTFDNVGGYSTLAFRLTIPTSATVTFEATFDGSNWQSVTMRQIGDDGYAQTSAVTGNYIGSISGVRKFRVRVSTAGSGTGTVMGRAQREASTLEGIEHAAPADNIGYAPVHKGVNISTAATTDIWTPATGKKFVVTDYDLTVQGTGSLNLKVFDGTDASGNWLFNGAFGTNSITGQTFQLSRSLVTPFVSSAVNNVLKITTDSTQTVKGVIIGYERF